MAAAGLRLEPRLGRPQPPPADDPAGAAALLRYHGAGTHSGRGYFAVVITSQTIN